MKTDSFYDNIICELQRQTHLYEKYKQKLDNSIEGYLYIRENPNSQTYYQVIPVGKKRKRINISDRADIIEQLLEKIIVKKALQTCRENK